MIDENLKNKDGESNLEVRKRMTESIMEILDKNQGKKIAVVSHGGSIKFFLLNWCEVNENVKLVNEGKELNITSPCLLKLTFNGIELVRLEQLN